MSPKLGATPATPMPIAASATPTGISQASESRSETRAERRLDDRGADRHEQQKGADRAVGISAFGDQERDQRGDGALAEIRDRVACRKDGQATAVEISESAAVRRSSLELQA